MLTGKVADPPDKLTDVARVDGFPHLDERVDALTDNVERKAGVVLRRSGRFEFGLHLGQRPKCREELVDQPRLAGLCGKHGYRPIRLSSKYGHHTEYLAESRYLLNSKSTICRELKHWIPNRSTLSR